MKESRISTSPFLREEIAQDRSTAVGQDPAEDLGAVVQTQVRWCLVKRIARAGFRFGSTIDDQRQPCLDAGSCARRAWCEGYAQNASIQPPGAKCLGRLGTGDHRRV